jgi:protein-tyrosine phosphatase
VGCDFHLSNENIQDAITNPRKYTINQQNYLLVEFSDLLIFNNTPEIFGRLQDAGMIPVITHPERNGLLRQRMENIEAWVGAGARVQLTAQSLLGNFGKRAQEFCEKMLDRGLAHFIASDAHDCEHRPPKMDEAYAWLEKKYGGEMAEALCVINPGAAVQGEPFDLPEKPMPSETRKWYQVWR